MKRIIIYLLLLCVAPALLHGQGAKYSNDFMNIGAGAQWMALGSTGVSLSNSVEAAYWNPANLTQMSNRFQVSALHASYFAGMASYNHMAIGHKVDSTAALAFSIIRFGVDDIPNTIDFIDSEGNLNYDRLSMFSVADYAFTLSYAKNMPIKGLSVGGSAKIIYRNVGKFASAFGFGIDAGANYMYKNWIFGATLKDVTTTFNLWNFNQEELEITIGDSTFNKVPENALELTLPQLTLGVARSFQLNNKVTLNAEFNAVTYFDGKRNMPLATSIASIEPRAGVELGYQNIVFFRFGINNLQKVKNFGNKTAYTIQPNAGIGIKFKGFSLDYALTNAGSVGFSKYSNIFSLTWGFNRLSTAKSTY